MKRGREGGKEGEKEKNDEPKTLASSALPGRFFTTSTTWEVQVV